MAEVEVIPRQKLGILRKHKLDWLAEMFEVFAGLGLVKIVEEEGETNAK